MEQELTDFAAFPTRKLWGKVFKPHLNEVQPLVTRVVRLTRPDFDPNKHTPRESGYQLDIVRPTSRTCARAYQMFGFCHLVAAYMLDLANKSSAGMDWVIYNAEGHSVVVSKKLHLVIDLNQEWSGPNIRSGQPQKVTLDKAELRYFNDHVLNAKNGFNVFTNVGGYMEHLEEHDWTR
jgi:hypothetical protein